MKRKLFEIGNKLDSDSHYDGEMKGWWLLLLRWPSVHLDMVLCICLFPLMFLFFTQRCSSDSPSSEELPVQGGYRGLRLSSSGSEEEVAELLDVGVCPPSNPPSLEQESPANCSGTGSNTAGQR